MFERLKTPQPAYGLSFFRALFGVILLGSVIRFWLKGWIAEIYIEPSYHFKYPFFEWVAVPGDPLFVYATFIFMGCMAAAIGIGLYPRVAAAFFCLAFTWVEFWDRTTYLNHYYFVSLATFLLAMLPTAGYFSVLPDRSARWVDGRIYACIKVLVGLVYFYAGIAKINSDWLFKGEPLATWLIAYEDLFTLNGLIPLRIVAIAMSWGGMLFDTTVPFFLLWRRSRPFAFLVAVVFHTIVGLLFPIGVFPFVMVGAITIFFDPAWPRLLWDRIRRLIPGLSCEQVEAFSKNLPEEAKVASFTGGRTGAVVVAIFLALQAVIPLRSFAYPGFQNWNDDGFAFSWRVMLVERVGSIDFFVEYDDGGRLMVYPRNQLTSQQYKLLSQSPDMMVSFAKDLKHRLDWLPYRDRIVKIGVNSYVAFNGRRSRRWIDPEVNLLDVGRLDFHDTFVLPLEGSEKH